MRLLLRSLGRDRAGSAAIESAFAIPVMIALIIGIMQVGMFFVANAGLRQAVESGARFASIYPTPVNADIVTRVRSNAYGMTASQITVATPVRGTDTTSGQNYIELTGTYPYTFNFIFFSSSAITLRYSRRIYLMPS